MQRLFAAVFVVTCVIGSTPGSARGIVHGSGAGIVRGAGAGVGGGVRLRQMPAMQNRIPTPLPPPSQPPVINGPLQQSPSGLPPMGGAR
jgi:hypothetical protein